MWLWWEREGTSMFEIQTFPENQGYILSWVRMELVFVNKFRVSMGLNNRAKMVPNRMWVVVAKLITIIRLIM